MTPPPCFEYDIPVSKSIEAISYPVRCDEWFDRAAETMFILLGGKAPLYF